MASLKAQFDAAAHAVQGLRKRPDNDALLKLYACYKQATIGDIQGKRPGLIDFAGRAKYDAWARMKGTSAQEAMQAYIHFVDELQRAQS